MSSDIALQDILKKAKEQERRYEWLEAAKSYEETLRSSLITSHFAAETWERIGFCYSLACRQAGNAEESKKLSQMAVEAYDSAAKIFEKEDGLRNQGESFQCNSFATYMRSCLAPNPVEKRRMLDECLKLGKKSLEAYESAGDSLSYGKMCNDLMLCLLDRIYLASDWAEMTNVLQEGTDCAGKAIAVLSKLADKSELLRAYSLASLQSWHAASNSEEEKRKELEQRSLLYSDEALRLSREVDNPYCGAMSSWAAAFCTLLFTEKAETALEYAKEMLRQGTVAKDNYLKGVAFYVLTFVTSWMMQREPDPDKRRKGQEEIIKYGEDAIRHLGLVSQDYFIAETYLFYAESYSSLALDCADLEKKRATLAKAVDNGRKGLEHAVHSGSPEAMISTLHPLSKALHFYSNLETGKDRKTKLLEEALAHRQEYNKIAERAFPLEDWMRGVGKNYEGLIKLELARIEPDNDKKKILLESAVVDMEDCMSRCRRWLLSRPVPTLMAVVGRFEDGFGGILNELYLLTGDKTVLNRSIEVYEDAASKFKKVTLSSRVAECYWRIAKNQNRLGQHQKAAENFANAFAEYKDAAQRIANFADFYLDYATYMNAWSEIEKALIAHETEKYADAMEYYAKVADLLEQTKLWRYLSSNFLAWSLLERAENLSRKESSVESIEAFHKAAVLFVEAKEAFEEEIEKIQNLDEKEKATELSEASLRRKDYCLARVSLEEARISDRKGSHTESAEKYDVAASSFEKLLETMKTESDRKELEPFACMCRAWQKMKMADSRVSPELYHEASDLFLKARDHCTRDRATLLASGNSAFCRALEHGSTFETTREKDDFFKAKQYLGSAAIYYMKAGFDNASVWTSATEILFDAYNYMISAEIEDDPEKKMKIYLLAEKCLEKSARLYETVGYVGKKDEVLRTLEKVKEKREFALSLGELLVVPSDASSTRAICAPGLTVEEPVGLLKFERELIQARLIAYQKEVMVGENWSLEFQLANLGRNAAFLVRMEGILPEGFDLMEVPEIYRMENSHLDMKGRRLDPLKTEVLKLVLASFDKGTYAIKPKVVYVDEVGHQMSCEPEPVTVEISEAILPNRITTGFRDLDTLLFGGIPKTYAVILTSPSCDERDSLIRKFLEAGARNDEVTFYVTIDPSRMRNLIESFQSSLCVFICNPRANEIIKNLPNVFKLKGVENLTDINIALSSAFRSIDESSSKPRRACIEIVSDILLQHHAVSARRWLTALIPELRSRGFTTLAVINPYMHPQEEAQAVEDIFEGEVVLYEKEGRRGSERFLKIKKMYNQKYLATELPLRKKRLMAQNREYG